MLMKVVKALLVLVVIIAFPPVLLALVPYWLWTRLRGRRDEPGLSASPAAAGLFSRRRRSWSLEDEAVQELYRLQKGRCKYCGRKVGKDFHVDHVVPFSRGGADHPSNLAVACPSCNLSKGDKLLHEWKQGPVAR